MYDQPNLTALLGYQLAQARVHAVEGGKVVVTAGQTRLVGGHGDRPAGAGQARNGGNGRGNGQPLVEGFDIGVGVMVDDAVAVENYQFHIGFPKRLRHCRA